MAKIISPSWKANILEQIQKPDFTSTISFNPAAQWLIVQLDNHKIPFRIISLGAGVKKIIRDDGVCPHCHKKL